MHAPCRLTRTRAPPNPAVGTSFTTSQLASISENKPSVFHATCYKFWLTCHQNSVIPWKCTLKISGNFWFTRPVGVVSPNKAVRDSLLNNCPDANCIRPRRRRASAVLRPTVERTSLMHKDKSDLPDSVLSIQVFPWCICDTSLRTPNAWATLEKLRAFGPSSVKAYPRCFIRECQLPKV